MAHLLRLIRPALYLVIGLLLGGVLTLAHAETVAATPQEIIVDPVQTASRAEAGIFYTTVLMPLSQAKTTAEGFAQQVCGSNARNWGMSWRYIVMAANAQQWERGYGCGAATSGNFARASTNGACPSGSTYDSVKGCVKSDWVCPDTTYTLDPVTHSCSRPTQCPTGYHIRTPDNGQCEKDCFGDQQQQADGACTCPKGNKTYWIGSMDQAAAFQGKGECAAGCVQKAGFIGIPFGGKWIVSGTTTGATCEGATTSGVIKATLPPPKPPTPPTPEQPADPKDTTKNNADPEDCVSSGGIYLSVGGMGKCSSPTPDNKSDAQKLTSGEKTTTTTNPDGSTTETTVKTKTITNPVTGEQSTSTSTTTTTKGPNGAVTGTTTTSSNGRGDAGGNNGNGDGTKGFCQENPDSSICKKSSWVGDCDVAPVCDGDAVQCATAKAVWEHRCVNKWAEKENDLSAGVDQQNLFGDQAKIDAAMNKNGDKDFDILATFQAKRQNYLTFASNCSHDLSFDFKGQHFAIDTTALCQIGMVVKVLMHLAAYMALIRMLTVKLF